MFSKKKAPEEMADIIAERMSGGVPEVVSFILEQLQDKLNIRLDSRRNEQVLFETFAFFMHIVDRMAFEALGVDGRVAFGDRLVSRIAGTLASTDLVERLRDTYNKRQVKYAQYQELLPPESKPLKGTLVWEFSKVVLELTGDSNPTTLVLICHMVSDWVPFMMQDALKVESVLKGD